MAQKHCRECGSQVSANAKICPHCGVHAPSVAELSSVLSPKVRTFNGYGRLITLLLIGGSILWLLAAQQNNSPSQNGTTSGNEETDKNIGLRNFENTLREEPWK